MSTQTINLTEYLYGQLKESNSPENKWYCSQYFGYEVTDPQQLLEYYIKHGGSLNYCSQHVSRLDPCKS